MRTCRGINSKCAPATSKFAQCFRAKVVVPPALLSLLFATSASVRDLLTPQLKGEREKRLSKPRVQVATGISKLGASIFRTGLESALLYASRTFFSAVGTNVRIIPGSNLACHRSA